LHHPAPPRYLFPRGWRLAWLRVTGAWRVPQLVRAHRERRRRLELHSNEVGRMDGQSARHEITLQKVLCEIPGMDAVRVRRDVEYRTTDSGALTMDVYSPPDATADAPRPAVVFLMGFSDVGGRKRLGCSAKEMESYVSWAKLVAATGLVAITYTTGVDPATDTPAAFDYVVQHAQRFGVHAGRVGVWACSGHGPTALSVLMRPAGARPRFAALFYPYTIDLDDRTEMVEAQKLWGFANPAAGKSAADIPADVPLFIVRAGLDQMPYLNSSLDRFIGAALASNLPMTVINHATGSHAFDISERSDATRAIVEQTLAFFARQGSATPAP
jgi:acetyl esterase/lipase